MKVKLALLVSIGLWVLPTVRMLRFGKWAWDYHSGSGSINSQNDLDYAARLGLAYLVGIFSMLLLCWLLSRRQTAVLWSLWSISCLCVAHATWIAPEVPIVLFPFFAPLRFGLTMGAVGVIGMASLFDSHKTIKMRS